MTIDLRRADGDRPFIPTLLMAVEAVLFVLLTVLVTTTWRPLIDLDQNVAEWAYDVTDGRPWLVDVLDIAATVTSNWSVGVALAILAGLLWWRNERLLAIWVVVSAVVVLGGNALIKLVVRRERPVWDLPLHEIGGHSFPSGHSAGAGLFFTVLALLTIVLTGRGLRRRLLLTLWIVLALVVAADRVFLGVHFLSDVTAGLCFGSFVPLLLWRLTVSGSGRAPAETAVLTGSGQRRAAVVLNPVKVGDVEDFKTKVRQVGALHGWGEPRWFETTVEDPGHGQTRAALDAGVDLIIAAGGDGTVRSVCEEATRSGVAIGVLPLGTGNLLARNLDIPVNTRDALDVVFGGQDRAIDLASFSTDGGTETSFLVMAGLGMDAMIMTGVNEDLKKRVGYLAYFLSGLKAVTFPRTKVAITLDNDPPRHFRARTVVIGNVGFLQAGIPLLPEAQIDDGVLDIVVVAPKRFIGWLSIVARVLMRRKSNDERLARLCAQKVHIRAEKPVPMQLDGDPVGEFQEITAQVHPGVVLVRVPASLAPAP
ncbi:YegS/Rv2252/BmrU family lipid kinase [Aeromicrobium senzhongii]|uniref:YegS/Rv2252/BmrU family lipid kinase n=1 Tax=Aeromicrobium senzhongii TaxID=2663859 RepID=A0ABX6SSU2_9ACTN|nr:YegS/Rv2252/BmrU family lipid kinase [Aeromicrobium senzhongii]MTB89360.1 YegS/Rv2252/BmrU family lipid kinase [Aeromicrobium senzhongii]QNL94488.1 YegS/Rv2252/BmrU family lipid kinase [Aeromicrobium senzhongii]